MGNLPETVFLVHDEVCVRTEDLPYTFMIEERPFCALCATFYPVQHDHTIDAGEMDFIEIRNNFPYCSLCQMYSTREHRTSRHHDERVQWSRFFMNLDRALGET